LDSSIFSNAAAFTCKAFRKPQAQEMKLQSHHFDRGSREL
jgi:hypothetical protein